MLNNVNDRIIKTLGLCGTMWDYVGLWSQAWASRPSKILRLWSIKIRSIGGERKLKVRSQKMWCHDNRIPKRSEVDFRSCSEDSAKKSKHFMIHGFQNETCRAQHYKICQPFTNHQSRKRMKWMKWMQVYGTLW